MTTEREDFDDPELAAFLRRWGSDATRSRRLFQPPGDLSAMHKALDAVDAELAGTPPGILERLKKSAESAARSAGEWIAERADEARGLASPLLRNARLALANEGTLRGAAETVFKSGDRIVIHLGLEQAGTVFVAMLTSGLELTAVSSAPRSLEKGQARLGPFRLDQQAGTESFVILVSEASRNPEDFRAIVDVAAQALSEAEAPASHDARLEACLLKLRQHPGLEVHALTFVHARE